MFLTPPFAYLSPKIPFTEQPGANSPGMGYDQEGGVFLD